MNIWGNGRADAAAKSALSLPITNMKLPACEVVSHVTKFCLDGRIFGTVVRVINFILFIPLLA